MKIIEEAKIIGFDTETTGLNVYSREDEVQGFSLAIRTSVGIVKEYFPMFHVRGKNMHEEDWRAILDKVIEKPLVGQNIGIFDTTAMRQYRFKITKFWDIMKLDHLIDENHISYEMDAISQRWLGYKGKEKSPMFNAAMLAYGWEGMPSDIMRDYGSTDAEVPLLVFEKMVEHIKIKEPDLPKYWRTIEAPNLLTLADMRRKGITTNIPLCKENEEQGEAVMQEMREWFGFNPASPKALHNLLINELGLPEIMKVRKRPGGVIESTPTFDKEAMKRYEVMLNRLAEEGNDRNIDIVNNLLRFRGWQKSVSGYYLPYQKFTGPDGRLRAEYKPHGTKTGRYACKTPNLQQIPKETDKEWNGQVKECLVSAENYILWELDYSQLEFRLNASASHEQKLIDVFNSADRDIFNEMSADLGWSRNDTKGFTYSVLYGAGKDRIMDVFGCDRDTAEELIEQFYETYPNLRRANAAMTLQGATGRVQIWSGRYRHFKYPSNEKRKSLNSYIQGGAADIVKTVMNKIFEEVCDVNCRLLLQVHDSLVFEIRQGMEEEYLPRIQEIMVKPDFGVRLAVDAHYWSKAEEIKNGSKVPNLSFFSH